jgi:hypothetical protein
MPEMTDYIESVTRRIPLRELIIEILHRTSGPVSGEQATGKQMRSGLRHGTQRVAIRWVKKVGEQAKHR